MEPTIVEKDRMVLVGFSFFGDPFALSSGWTEDNEIGRLWRRYGAYLANNADRMQRVRDREVCYEVHVEHEETASLGHFEVFVGIEVEDLDDVPAELLVKVLPPTLYAVFTFSGGQITSDWQQLIDRDWMPKSGYEQAYRYSFQLYDRRFKGMDRLEESEIDVYIPIRRRA
jgi:AraC family transcriptional regulator